MSEDPIIDDYVDSPISLVAIIATTLGVGTLLATLILILNTSMADNNHKKFVYGVSTATRAYAQQYTLDTKSLKNIAEGYITDEDIQKYKVDTNPLNIDLLGAQDYFYRLLSSNSGITKSKLLDMDLYMIQVTTKFNPSPVYIINIYKDVATPMVVNHQTTSLVTMQNLIEDTIGVKIDINKDFNASIRKAQDYDKKGTTGSGDKTYSTYTTHMCIGKDVQIPGLSGKMKYDISEIQSYSVIR